MFVYHTGRLENVTRSFYTGSGVFHLK